MPEFVVMNGVTINPTLIFNRLEEIFPDREKFPEWRNDKANPRDISWVQTPLDDIPEIVNLLEIKHRSKLIDLGCGDGRILVGSVIFADLAGCRIKCVGYETRPSLVGYAREKVRTVGLEDRIRIEQVDILNDDLSELRKFDRVYDYTYEDTNFSVAPSLEAYLPKGSIVLSRDYSLPRSWEKYRVPYNRIPKDLFHKYKIRN